MKLTFGVFALALSAAFAAPPQRIISVSPSVTEILYGVGALDRVVAVSDYCTYPPRVKSLPRVGGWHTPNLERLAALKPDLVVMTEAQVPFIGEQLQQLDIKTLVTKSQSVEDAFQAIELIGQATGNARQAALLVGATKSALEKVRTRAGTLPRPAVLCVVDRTPGTLRDLYATGRGSFLAELIETAGGRAIAAPAHAEYGRLSKETVLALNPQIIFDLMRGSSGQTARVMQAAWRDLPELEAVRRGKVSQIREEFVPHASQMIAQTAVLFARLLHPEVPPEEWEMQ
jgi:iron complex transport system substrate-binding protein